MSEPVTVSVVIPCYNAVLFLRETLESVFCQTYPVQEIIVVDDGSTDDSAAIAESFGPPVRLIRQPNQGESVARNRGVEEACGSHVLFLDSDDLLLEHAVEIAVGCISDRPGAVFLGGHKVFEGGRENVTQTVVQKIDGLLPAGLTSCVAPPHCWLYPRSLVQSIGGFASDIRHGEDWDFCARIGLSGAPLVVSPEIIALYRRRVGSQSTSKAKDKNRNAEFTRTAERLCRKLAADLQYSQRYGNAMFWRVVSQTQYSRAAGLSWNDLGPLCEAADLLCQQLRRTSQDTQLARIVRLLGFRRTLRMRELFSWNGP